MLPLGIFSVAAFSATNIVTFAVYAALGGVSSWWCVNLQVVAGLSPLAAGTALLPVTMLMLLLSRAMRRAGHPDRAADPDDRRPAALRRAALVLLVPGRRRRVVPDATSCPPWCCSASGCRSPSRR